MGAHVALMSRGGSGSNNHKTPSRSCPARTTSEANPFEQSCILYSDMLRCPTDSRPPAPPMPQFRFRRQPFASTAWRKKKKKYWAKKREFLSFIRRFPRSPLPHPLHPPPLLFLYMYIYFLSCRRRKDFLFFLTCKLDALLGSASATEMQRQSERERKIETVAAPGAGLGGGGRRDCVTGTQIFNLLNFSP